MKLDQLVDEKYLRSILDAFPIPVLIVDKGLTIHDPIQSWCLPRL